MARPPLSPVSSLTEFIGAIKAAQPERGFLAFRGHRKAGWGIDPAIHREPKKLLRSEKQAVRDLLSIHPQEFASDSTMLDRLVRMQHFGLPTRLLDVTANPLVAMYFATEPELNPVDTPDGEVIILTVPDSRKKYYDSDAVSCIANLANLTPEEKDGISDSKAEPIDRFNKLKPIDRLLQFIRAEKPYFRAEIEPDDLFRSNYVVPKLNNRRIIAQSGAFIIYALSRETIISSKRELIRGNRIPITGAAKAGIRADLEMLGIHEGTLFPEIDSAARYVSRRYS